METKIIAPALVEKIRRSGNDVLIKGIPSHALNNIYEKLRQDIRQPLVLWRYENLGEYRRLRKSYMSIIRGEVFAPESLRTLGYDRVQKVDAIGEYAVVGDIVTIWGMHERFPLRIDLWGEEVEEIAVLDPDTRQSRYSLNNIVLHIREDQAKIVDIPDPGNVKPISLVYIEDDLFVSDEEFPEVVDLGLQSVPFPREITEHSGVSRRRQIIAQLQNAPVSVTKIVYVTTNDDADRTVLDEYAKAGFEVDTLTVPTTDWRSFERGVIVEEGGLAVLTDFEVMGKVELYPAGVRTAERFLSSIKVGDLVVHEDHGVGRFIGMVSLDRGGSGFVQKDGHSPIDAFVLQYANKDRLYVPVSVSYKLHKYVGIGKNVKLTTLNNGSWKRAVKKATADTRKLAADLARIYAMRKTVKVEPVIGSQTDEMHISAFIDSFPYTDTEDQTVATREILDDLRRDYPMDRLLVGDVGFGKTEVAMRAIFAVVNSHRQVALLAPTTVLVAQHFEVLKERMRDFAVNIEMLSGFVPAKKAKIIKERLADGDIDIIVGTQSILQDSVKYKDLALLVIDEEQRFGVKQKEKLRKLRLDLHVLSLSATPIPRSLNMALNGVRDISTILTPPVGRKSVKNEFAKFTWDKVTEAITKELQRGGQVYFVHNRVRDLSRYLRQIRALFPQHTVEILHGRMSGMEIQNVMRSFVKGDIDVLVTTTIIQNGLDLPNVNTIIIDKANMFGLSQLYQLRGRVGRAKRQAFAYFLVGEADETTQGARVDGTMEAMGSEVVMDIGVDDNVVVVDRRSGVESESMGDGQQPIKSGGRDLTDTAIARLNALRESERLGSGFTLASKDIQIRGVGNLLGREQSGVINAVGLGMYMRMMEGYRTLRP